MRKRTESSVQGVSGSCRFGDTHWCPHPFEPICGLLERSQFVHDNTHRSPFRGSHADKLPSDNAFAINNEGRRSRNTFLRMQHVIGINVRSQRIGNNGIPQAQIHDGLARRHLGVRTEGYELGIETLHLFVIRLQLPELR